MPEFCAPIEVWFDADDEAEACRIADEIGDAVQGLEVVSAVANGTPEERS